MRNSAIIILFLFCNLSVKCQNITSKSEKNIFVNNLNILDKFNHSSILNKVGQPVKVNDGGQDQIEEFGYQTYDYYYGESYISFRGDYISDIFIFDDNLSINKIKIGSSLDLVKKEFPKYNIIDGALKIYYDDFTLTFSYKNNIVTEITYYTPM